MPCLNLQPGATPTSGSLLLTIIHCSMQNESSTEEGYLLLAEVSCLHQYEWNSLLDHIYGISVGTVLYLSNTGCCGPWLPVQTFSIPSSLWTLFAKVLFPFPSNSLQLHLSIFSVHPILLAHPFWHSFVIQPLGTFIPS